MTLEINPARDTYIETILENSPIGFAVYETASGIVQFVNRRFEEIFGVARGTFTSRESFYEHVYGDPVERERVRSRVRSAAAEGVQTGFNWERFSVTLPSGEVRYLTMTNFKIADQNVMAATVQDVTAQALADNRIKHALGEKETLLHELYHRTMNNMSLVMAMLRMQADHIGDERLRMAMADTIDRIQAMALVQKKLYESKDLSRINLRPYIADLAALLMARHKVIPGRVSLVPDMDDAWVLIDTAIPFGLVVCELVSNALKYAFPGDRCGTIRLGLRREAGGDIDFTLADDGVGFPAGFDPRHGGHMGLEILFDLAEKQLHAVIVFMSPPGVACRLRFRDDLNRPRI